MLNGDRADQLGAHLDAVAGHHHLHVAAVVSGEGGDLTGHIRGADIELRPVTGKEGGVATALFLLQHIHLTFELGVGLDRIGLHQHHATLDIFLLDTAQQQAHVVTCHALVEQLAEHLHAGHGGFAGVPDAHDLHGFTHLHLAALDSAGGHGAAAGDRKHVFDRHQEGLVDLARRLGDRLIHRIHQIEDLVDPFVFTADALATALDVLESPEGGASDHGDVIAGEVVAAQEFTHFKFDEFEDFFVVDHIFLIQEHHKGRHPYLLR